MKQKRTRQDENFAVQSKRPKAEGLERGGPGLDYQAQLLMFFAHKGHTFGQNIKGYAFEIGKERKEAGKFDDIVVRYRLQEDQPWNYLLIQAKYTADVITLGKLLSSDMKAPFTLLKYFSSYIEVKNNYKTDKIETCVIATNTDFEYNSEEPLKLKGYSRKKNIQFYVVDEKQNNSVNDIFIEGEMQNTKYYKLNKKEIFLKELQKEFKQQYDELKSNKSKKKHTQTEEEVVRNLTDIISPGQDFTKELEQFLDKLLFIVNLPKRDNLRLITKQKIGEEFSFLDDSIVDQFNRKMFNYLISLGQDFLGRDEIDKFFLKMKMNIDSIMCSNNNYYLKIQNCKLDFVSNESIIPNFLLLSNEQILILKTDSMFLTAVKINQILKEISLTSPNSQYFYRNNYTFINFEQLLKIKVLQNTLIQSFSCENENNCNCKEECNLCIIILDSRDTKKEKDLLNELYSILYKNNGKKVIFVIERHVELQWTAFMSQDILKQHEDNVNYFNDLTETSKRNLLEKNVVFQGENIKLKSLYFNLKDDEEPLLQQLNCLTFDTKTLESLIDNTLKVEKSFSVSNLEGAYHTFYEEIEKSHLFDYLDNLEKTSIVNQNERFVFISGIEESGKEDSSRKALRDLTNSWSITKDANFLNDLEIRAKISKMLILPKSKRSGKDEFYQLCHNSPNKVFYWIDWKNNKLVLHGLYYPHFLQRDFEYPEKVIIQDSFKSELCKCDNNSFIISGVKTIDQFFEVLQIEDEEVKNKIIERYILEKISIKMEMNECEFENFKKGDESIHWLQIENCNDIKQIIWRKSHGSLDIFQSYCDIKRNRLSEDELINMIKNRSSIIVEKPGMGKSTTLYTLSEKMLKSHWVVFVTLKCWQKIIDDLPENIDVKVIIEFLTRTANITTCLEKNLLQYTLSNTRGSGAKPLLLLFDGFDEIRSYDHENSGKKKFANLLKFIENETSATVWITAREHDKIQLQDALSTFDIKFKALERNQQYKFFWDNWNTSLAMTISQNALDQTFSVEDSKFDRYFSELSNATATILADRNNDFMGIPLTLRLFAESFRSRFKKYLHSAEEDFKKDFDQVSKLNLYKYFIDEKFQIFLSEKTNLLSGFTEVSEDMLRNEIMKRHWRLAFKEVFGRELCKNLLGSKPPFEGEDLNINYEQLQELLSFGIVRSTGEEHFEFLHRTFAEYFLSELFVYMLISKKQSNETKYKKVLAFLRLEILKQSNGVILHFMNSKSQTNEKLKIIWDMITSGEGEGGNLLDEATNKNRFIIKQMVIGESNNNIKALREAVESFVKWSVDKKSFAYRENDTYVGTLTELLMQCFLEKDSLQLKLTLRFLTKLHGKTVFRIFNRTLTAAKLESILSVYISQATEAQATCDIQFVQDCVHNIFKINDNVLERKMNQKFNCDFRKKYLSNSCNIMSKDDFRQFTQICMDVYEESGTLALEMINAYIFQLSKNDSIKAFVGETRDFLKNVLPLLLSSNYYFPKYNPDSNFKIDAFSAVKVFASMEHEIIEGIELTTASLLGLLKCIRDITHVDNICNEKFLCSIYSLLALRHWDFRLIYDDMKRLVLYHNRTNFKVPLELEYEPKIVNLLKIRHRLLRPGFESECAEVVKYVKERN